MPVYSYKATDPNRAAVVGVITGDSPRQARDQLRNQGLSVREIREESASEGQTGKSYSLTIGWPQNYQAKIAAMAGELSTLLSVGVPLLESLDTLIRQYSGKFKTSMLVLRDQVEAGGSLAEAMSDQPRVFDSLTINMVEVGENAGNLEQVLPRYEIWPLRVPLARTVAVTVHDKILIRSDSRGANPFFDDHVGCKKQRFTGRKVRQTLAA